MVTTRPLDPVTRTRLLMALLGLMLTGVALLGLVLLLGKMVRRRAQDRLPPSRYVSRGPTAGPLPDRDPPQDLPPGMTPERRDSL